MSYPRTVENNSVTELVAQGMQLMLDQFHKDLAEGMPRIGWKIGITTAAAQKPHGLTSSVIGSLNGNRSFSSGDKAVLNPKGKFRAEAEIALRLDKEILPEMPLEEVRHAICGVGPAIEFIDLNKPADDISVILSHNIFHEAVIFGEEVSPEILQQETSLWPLGRRNRKCVRTPEPAMIPTDLAALVLHVAKTLSCYGERLLAGDRIISGSYIIPLIVEPGDLIEIDFGVFEKVLIQTIAS